MSKKSKARARPGPVPPAKPAPPNGFGAAVPKRLRPLARRQPSGSPDWLGRKPVWSFALADLEHQGSWGWHLVGDKLTKLLQNLAQMEELTWAEIRRGATSSGHSRSHFIPTHELSVEARRRLEALGLEDVDEVFSFRVGSRERLWAVSLPQSAACYILWWDPNHMVYPTAKRGT